ncbi:hypothetical protein [Metabacillus litoralis]|nr:hypothetical protein [Metabacillus litoralis]
MWISTLQVTDRLMKEEQEVIWTDKPLVLLSIFVDDKVLNK